MFHKYNFNLTEIGNYSGIGLRRVAKQMTGRQAYATQ